MYHPLWRYLEPPFFKCRGSRGSCIPRDSRTYWREDYLDPVQMEQGYSGEIVSTEIKIAVGVVMMILVGIGIGQRIKRVAKDLAAAAQAHQAERKARLRRAEPPQR